MRVAFILAALMVSLVSVTHAGLILVEPTNTYLRVNGEADPLSRFNPVWLDLTAVGATPGSTLLLSTQGEICFVGTSDCWATALGAVFASSNDYFPPSYTGLNRITFPIGASPPAGTTPLVSPNTNDGDYPTDIPQDFVVPNGSTLLVEVPAGATWMAFGVIDSYYSDNTTPGSPAAFGLYYEAGVPEPGTFALLATGLGLLLALRQKRQSQ